MEIVKNEIDLALKTVKLEKYQNIRYEIKCNIAEDKEALKSLLIQGPSTQYATIVEIDFVKSKLKTSRKGRLADKKFPAEGIEIFNYREDGPIIKIYNSPIYLYSEYIKMSRNMSQSPLTINGKNKVERSVSDFCDGIRSYFNPGQVKFMASGREDIDVQCLEGRPFILEIQYPSKNLEFSELDLKLYEEVDLINTYLVTKETKDVVNCGTPTKTYSLLIYSKEEIPFYDFYTIAQKTPLRVLHRRANMIRNKTINVLRSESTKEEDGYYYKIDIRTSSGTYVKEWVNGDFNRTQPNLNSDLLELDIIKVEQTLEESYIIKPIKINKIK